MDDKAAEILRADSSPAIVDWQDKQELIRRTVAAGATNDELELFFHQARRSGLDPLAKQIYYVKRKGKGTIQVGIDGLRLVAQRSGQYAGSDDAVFVEPDGPGFPEKATVTVWRMVDGHRCAFTASARWREYYPGDDQGFQWKKMPYAMLGKCAEALALRKGFPADMSGLYIHEEMDQAGKADAITVEAEPETPPAPAKAPPPAPAKAPAPAPPATPRIDEPPKDTNAFGFVPVRWPLPKMFTEPMTESQAKMEASKSKDREIDADDVGAVKALVLESYGLIPDQSKAMSSLFLDWLINADEDALDSAVELLDARKELEIQDAVLIVDPESPRGKFETFCEMRRWPIFSNGEGACRTVYSEFLGRRVMAPQDLTDNDWTKLHSWALHKTAPNTETEPRPFKAHRLAEEITHGK